MYKKSFRGIVVLDNGLLWAKGRAGLRTRKCGDIPEVLSVLGDTYVPYRALHLTDTRFAKFRLGCLL